MAKGSTGTAKTEAKTSAAREYASAMDKLRDEMETDHSRYVTVVGEYLTNYLLEHPEAEAALLNSAKTIHGSLKQLEAEARKQGGKVGIIADAEAFGMVLEYFGISEATGNRDIERPENSPVDCFQRDGAGKPVGTGNRGTVEAQAADISTLHSPHSTLKAPDPFDLDALLGVG